MGFYQLTSNGEVAQSDGFPPRWQAWCGDALVAASDDLRKMLARARGLCEDGLDLVIWEQGGSDPWEPTWTPLYAVMRLHRKVAVLYLREGVGV